MSQKNMESQAYFENRSLARGSVGWLLLVGLGIAYVVSGDYSGWNYGIAHGGWFGLLIAVVCMGTMYTCMVLGLAELSSTLSTAGGGYGFARAAMGQVGGFMTGMALMIEYVCAPPAISTFIANYVSALGILPEIDHAWIILAFFLFFIGILCLGVGEALKVMFAITAVALFALIVFYGSMLPEFSVSNLFNIAPTDATGASVLLPYGFAGLIATLPFGMWLFLGIEGVPLAAEEAADPKRDLPKGLLVAMSVLICTAFLAMLLSAGGAGAEFIGKADAPLVDALNAVGKSGVATFINFVGLAGLIASFFSMMYAGSRQIFALSRAGYIPKFLSITSAKKVPVYAVIIPSTIGFCVAVYMKNGDQILNVAVFGACISYAMVNLSHILLRIKAPEVKRGYRTPGGVFTTGVAFVLSCVALVSTFFVDMVAASTVFGLFVLGVLYYFFYARHHLVANAPEEAFAAEAVEKA